MSLLLFSVPEPAYRWPDRLLVKLDYAYQALDRLAENINLPTIDVEAVMSQLLHCLEIVQLTDALLELQLNDLMEYAFEDAQFSDFPNQRLEVRDQLRTIVTRANWQLHQNQIYGPLGLPYDYVERKHSGYALLRRKKELTL